MFFVDIPRQATVGEPQLPFQKKTPCRSMTKALQTKKNRKSAGVSTLSIFEMLTVRRYSSATLRFLSLSINPIQTCAPPSTRAKKPAMAENITCVV